MITKSTIADKIAGLGFRLLKTALSKKNLSKPPKNPEIKRISHDTSHPSKTTH